MFKVNNKNTRTICEICSKLTITYFTPCSSVSIVNFEQVNGGWVNNCYSEKKQSAEAATQVAL